MASDEATQQCEKVASLYRRGKTHQQIAETLNISVRSVSRHMERARAIWREAASATYQEHLCEQLAKIDEAEAAAWEGWERSVRDELSTVTEDGETPKGSVSKTKVGRKNQSGQATFIATITSLITLRCRLLGLLDPEAGKDHQTDGTPVVSIVVGNREEAESLRMLTVAEYQQKLAESRQTAVSLPGEGE